MSTLWVQSKYSKDARKFEVTESGPYFHYWQPPDRGFVLPKEEYIPCDPPERWEVCTRDRVGLSENGMRLSVASNLPVYVSAGYRWAWSEKDPDALVIKRKVP